VTIRSLESLFNPSAIALVGASKTPGSIGWVLARNLMSAGFDGPIMPVNPKHRAVGGVLAWPNVAALPVVPDLAVVSTPPDVVPGVLLANRPIKSQAPRFHDITSTILQVFGIEPPQDMTGAPVL